MHLYGLLSQQKIRVGVRGVREKTEKEKNYIKRGGIGLKNTSFWAIISKKIEGPPPLLRKICVRLKCVCFNLKLLLDTNKIGIISIMLNNYRIDVILDLY